MLLINQAAVKKATMQLHAALFKAMQAGKRVHTQ